MSRVETFKEPVLSSPIEVMVRPLSAPSHPSDSWLYFCSIFMPPPMC